MNRNAIVICLAASLAACSSSSDNSNNDCAPAGTYIMSFSRSAVPGDCPATMQPASQSINVKANDACGMYTSSSSSTDANGCMDTGTVTATANGSGLTNGKVSVTVDCTAGGGSKCTANFDLTFTKQ